MIRSITTGLWLLVTFVNLQAQTLIEKTYGGKEDDYPFAMIQTSDGGYAMAGGSYTNHIFNAYLVKTDADGDTLWARSYINPQGYHSFTSIVEINNHGYLVLGQAADGKSLFPVVRLTHLGANGDTLWTKQYAGTNALKIIKTNDDQYAFLVTSTTVDGLMLYKVNTSGDILWSKNYTASTSKDMGDFEEASDKGFVIGMDIDHDAYLLKTNSIGDSLWAKRYNKEGTQNISTLTITKDDHYILGGNSFGIASNSLSKIYIIETNSAGDTVRTKSYGTDTEDLYLQDVKQSSDGNIYMLGDNNEDALLIKTDSKGNTLFSKTYGGAGDESGIVLLLSSDNQTLSLLSSTESKGAGATDFLFIQMDASGNILSGMSDQTFAAVQIAPNPFTDQIMIKLQGEAQVNIYDAMGTVVGNYSVDQQKYISMQGAKGMYYIKITKDQQTAIYKMVKQ